MSNLRVTSIWQRIGSGFASLFVLLAALVQIGSTFHRHDDRRVHDDCGACVLGQQIQSADSTSPVVVVPTAGLLEFLDLADGPDPVDPSSFSPSARGPPSLV